MPVGPGIDIHKAIDANPAGTTLCILPGVYRLSTGLAPKDRDQFLGEVGAVLSGSKVLTTWTESGNQWTHTGDTHNPGSVVGTCQDGTDACAYPDDVYLDDARLTRVLSLSDLAPGRVYIDYGKDEVHIAEDPSGHRVELASATQAFTDAGSDVLVQGLVVEKFANMASLDEDACISMGSGWVVDGVEVRYCHGIGVSGGDHSILRNSRVHHMGQLGLSGNGETGSVFEDNEVDHNNTAGYDWGWSGGGSKWVKTVGLVARGNRVHDNTGPGLWTDIANRGTAYEDNIVTNNAGSGILHEISYDVVIRNNIASGNGTRHGNAQINITDSGGRGSLVTGNVVTVSALDPFVGGILLTQDDRESDGYVTQNVIVSVNAVTMCSGVSGADTYTGNQIFARNNHFENNTYYVKNMTGEFWDWEDSRQTWSSWQAFGNDVDGRRLLASCLRVGIR